jgi:hypothetical protein
MLVAALALIPGCPDPSPSDDAGPADAGRDAAALIDAPSDALAGDTGSEDASSPDGGAADGGLADSGMPDAGGPELPVDCADPGTLAPNTRVLIDAARGAALDGCASSSAAGASLYYSIDVPAGEHLSVATFGTASLSLRRACTPCDPLDRRFYRNTTDTTETLLLSVSGETSVEWPSGYPVYATVTPTPADGTCASATPLTPPATLTELTTVGATSAVFDHCDFSTDEQARYRSVEVPAGMRLTVTVTSVFLGPGGTPAAAFVLDSCTTSSDQCLAQRAGGVPARTRWTNEGTAARTVLVALTGGMTSRFTATFAIDAP